MGIFCINNNRVILGYTYFWKFPILGLFIYRYNLQIKTDQGLVDDLENLFDSYLKTWIKSNSEILDILKKI
jgi:phosphatidylserine/phosphatidylglycerophosphate/cardiolipin synthase-like enzyme